MIPINLKKKIITIEEIHSYGTTTRSSKNGNFNVKFCKTKRKLMLKVLWVLNYGTN